MRKLRPQPQARAAPGSLPGPAAWQAWVFAGKLRRYAGALQGRNQGRKTNKPNKKYCIFLATYPGSDGARLGPAQLGEGFSQGAVWIWGVASF